MIKTALVILVIAMAGLVAFGVSARVKGQESPTPSAPSAPSVSTASPADRDPSAQRTNYSFAQDGTVRRTMNPGFCQRNASDYYVKAGKVVCEGY